MVDPRGKESDERLRRLKAVTDAALSRLELEDLLDELLDRIRDLLSADTATVLLVDSSGRQLVATAAKGLEEEVRQGVRVPIGLGFAGTVAERGAPVSIEHVDPTNVVNPILVENVASVLGVPMISDGRVIGVLHVGTRSPRRFTDDDIDLLQLAADRAATATQARLSRLDRATALALQRSLLPALPSDIPGLDMACRYVPGAAVGVGGDWYDVFRLPSGHVGIAIGDVAGSGLRAAVVMGRIRSALRAYALESTDPANVLAKLDRKIQLFEPGVMATVLYAVIEPSLSNVTMSAAGHLPPVIVEADRPAALVDITADLPVGAAPDAPRRNTVVALAPGRGLFFYTDGLIERRDRPIADGLERLAIALQAGPAEEMCARTIASFLHNEVATDDVAVLAVRRVESS
ncbi:MAG TPA: GAF domain-containing SpoIIE family protein phosphatase [Micromonosporaceae bacterium]|jgi:putative methionine-R-sulfoxide reductase with GAF domain|nr:GAF domain-containing SpoIIE family protein phosphatase [Micromonosporaceae bacterium]